MNRYLNHHLAEQFVAMLCIGRGVWWPKQDVALQMDTIEKLANLRADVGVQWMLFNQCMAAARQAIDMVHTLQKLVGTVERVTELIELLDHVTSSSSTENEKNFLDDECIAFENVDIITPGGVTLVSATSVALLARFCVHGVLYLLVAWLNISLCCVRSAVCCLWAALCTLWAAGQKPVFSVGAG
jgi:hypothetical protein